MLIEFSVWRSYCAGLPEPTLHFPRLVFTCLSDAEHKAAELTLNRICLSKVLFTVKIVVLAGNCTPDKFRGPEAFY